jgi:hypothetical protein
LRQALHRPFRIVAAIPVSILPGFWKDRDWQEEIVTQPAMFTGFEACFDDAGIE